VSEQPSKETLALPIFAEATEDEIRTAADLVTWAEACPAVNYFICTPTDADATVAPPDDMLPTKL
jgi:hypothetical protein